MSEEIDIFELVKNITNIIKVRETNVKCSEVYLSKDKYINIEIEENSIKNSTLGTEMGVSVRVIDNRGSLGFSFTNKFEKKTIDKIVNTAIKMMKVGTSDPDFKDLPKKPKNYPSIRGLYDKNIEQIEVEDSSQYVEDLIKVCEEDELAISQSANFKSNYSEIYIINSNGLEVSSKNTICSISSNIIVKDKITKKTSFGFDWQSVRNIKDLNAQKIAINALKNAKRHLNRKGVNNMKIPLVLTPTGTINLILQPLISAINAEAFQYKRSFLVEKKGNQIGSELLNIEDNALIEGGTGSSIFDDEGTPCKNKKIIEKGKFLEQGLLHNSYTAAKEGIESTGNAMRSSYSSLPSIDATNFNLKPGTISKEELINDIKQGILFEYSGDSANISTGDFSGLILQGNLIENGEIKHSLNKTMFGINLMDLFQNISQISKEYKIYGPYQAPYVKIDNVQIIGNAN